MSDRLIFPPVHGPRKDEPAGDATPQQEAQQAAPSAPAAPAIPAVLAHQAATGGEASPALPEPPDDGFKALLRTEAEPAATTLVASAEPNEAMTSIGGAVPAVPDRPAAQAPPSFAPAIGSLEALTEAAANQEGADDSSPSSVSWYRKVPWWGWLIAAVVLMCGSIVAFWIAQNSGSSTVAVSNVVVTAPAPTSSVSPVDRGEGSALHQAIPGTVNQYALTKLQAESTWVADRGAIEAFTATYSGAVDPLDATSAQGTYTVTVGQWSTAKEATTEAKKLAASLVGDQAVQGDVMVSGKKVGQSWSAPATAAGADSTAEATTVWTNGTVVLSATGPASDLARFFAGYGL